MRIIFQRGSQAYLPDNGQSMRTGLPRYQPALWAGTRALLMESGATNLLTANQSSVETDTTGFTSVSGATLARVTGLSFHGLACLRVTTGTTASAGVQVVHTTSTQGTYVGRFHVRSAQSPDVDAWLRILYTNATFDDTPQVHIPQGGSAQWFDIATDAVVSNAAKTVASVQLHVRRVIGTANIFFEIDAIQIELASAPTSWHLGGGATRVAEIATLPAYELINNEETTIEGWLKLTSVVGDFRYIVDAMQRPEQSSITNRWYLRITSDGELQFVFWGGLTQLAMTSSPLPANVWTHFAVKWHRGGASIYLNGDPVSTTLNRPILLLPLLQIHLGTNSFGNQPLNGLLSSVRFTRRARSDGEIMAFYSNANNYEPGTFFDSIDQRPDSRVFTLDGTLNSRPGSQNLYIPETDFVIPTTCDASTSATDFPANNMKDYEFPLLPHRTTTIGLTVLAFDFGNGVNISAIWMGLTNYFGGYAEYSWNGVDYVGVVNGAIMCPPDDDGDGYRKGWTPVSFSARYVRIWVPTQLVDGAADYFETPLVLFAADTRGLQANREWGTQFSVQYDIEESNAGGHDDVTVRGERYVQLQVRGMARHGESNDWMDLIRLGAHRKFLWLNNLGKPEQSWLFRLSGQASWEENWNPLISVTFKEHIN